MRVVLAALSLLIPVSVSAQSFAMPPADHSHGNLHRDMALQTRSVVFVQTYLVRGLGWISMAGQFNPYHIPTID